MDVLEARETLARRWWIVLVGSIVTLVAVGYVLVAVPLTYKADGTLVLVPPAQDVIDNHLARNPFLSFSSSLNVVASLTIQALQDKTAVDVLKRQGATAPYTLGTGNDGKTPLITVLSKSGAPDEAVRTTQVVMAGVQTQLAAEQTDQHAPPDTFITATVITHPVQATKSWSAKLNDLVLVIGFGGAVTFLAIGGVERRYRRRLAEPLSLFDASAAHQRGAG